jgi:hypothetical protein
LSGEYEAKAPSEAPGTFAPPADEVRREMLRLELAALEAEVQARQAEAVALAVAASEGRPSEAGDAAEVGDSEPGPTESAAEGAVEHAIGEEPREG